KGQGRKKISPAALSWWLPVHPKKNLPAALSWANYTPQKFSPAALSRANCTLQKNFACGAELGLTVTPKNSPAAPTPTYLPTILLTYLQPTHNLPSITLPS